jgi:serine/threonine kinase 3
MNILTESELNLDPLLVFELGEKVGEGSFGSVHKAVHKSSGHTVAIKLIPIDNDIQATMKEIHIIQEFASQFVVKFYGAYTKDRELWIVMEFCACGSVSDVMKICNSCFPEDAVSIICKDVLQGLSYLHQTGKIHRDIKAG